MTLELRPILYVEDNLDDALFFRRALGKVGFDVPLETARDGEEAIAYLRGEGPCLDRSKHPLPALIVLDLKLPRRSGLEVLAWLRGEPILRDIPVIILTSSREERDIRRARELGVDDYQVKPTHFEQLAHILNGIACRWREAAEGR